MTRSLLLQPPVGPCLLSVPLLRHMLADPAITIRRRAVDRNWYYEGLLSVAVGGFNPFRRSVYIGAESAVAAWLDGGCTDDREHNAADALVGEVLFLVHDYLHCWSVLEIQRMRPDLGFGSAPIDHDNFAAMVFCQLLTEAAATIGLDYWYLATIDLNQVIDCGTCYRTLAVPYHERHLHEYRRSNPAWDTQSVDAFERLTRFYCTGSFPGFSVDDFRRSALLYTWLNHEIRYGVNQRAYTRQWLAHLSNGAIELAHADSKGPVACEADWQRDLTRRLGERLWAKVKGDEPPTLRADQGAEPWRREVACADFRFVNVNALEEAERRRLAADPNAGRDFNYFAAQYLSRCRLSSFPRARVHELRQALREANVAALVDVVDDPSIAKLTPTPGEDEPLDLMFLN